jgi:phosphatidylinositol alpha-mannosyltransferase
MREAAVFVICLDDPGVSAGQVRLMTAAELGTPVIATSGAALDGYLESGVNAVVVPGGDPNALAVAVDQLLDDGSERDRLAASALERARARTYSTYFDDVRRLIREALPK